MQIQKYSAGAKFSQLNAFVHWLRQKGEMQSILKFKLIEVLLKVFDLLCT